MPGVFFTATLKLKHAKPPVTRKLEIPDMTLGELHEVIQTAFGWSNSHLHEFVIGRDWRLGPELADDGFGGDMGLPPQDDEESVWLSELDASEAAAIHYTYDFGDNWEVDVKLSAAKPKQEGVLYPRIIEGKRPPTTAAVCGYQELCDLMRKPAAELTEDDQERLEWCGRFDPDTVDLTAINAEYEKRDAPKTRTKKAATKKKK